MARYILLNIVVMATALLISRRRSLKLSRAHIIALGLVLLLTLIFDSILVLQSIIDYNSSYILGLRIWAAPVEDFCYPILAVFITPVVWKHFGKEKTHA